MFYVSALRYLLLYDILAAQSRQYSPVTKLAIQGCEIQYIIQLWNLVLMESNFSILQGLQSTIMYLNTISRQSKMIDS